MTKAVKLTTVQMAEFAATGVLRFDALVPEPINLRFLEQLETCLLPAQRSGALPADPMAVYATLMQQQALPAVVPGSPWREAFASESALGQLLRLPQVEGAIDSLVGPRAVVDHQFLHLTLPPKNSARETAQHYHQDSTIDPRPNFDVQIMYFPHAVDAEMGGTRYLPGSHLRIVSESAIARYQNIAGQQHVVCPAGTLLFLHHGIWHGGGANRSKQRRFMWKLRLCPQEPQVRLWDTDDLPPDHLQQRPIFWTDPNADRDPVHAQLTRKQPWFEADTSRLEYINRIKFWRRLLGDAQFDADYWLTRLENEF
ncbi:MAG: phytanoyl-CoA dioxygenase family protein [Pseudomonadales bacterium]